MDGCNKNEILEKVNLYLKRFDIDKFKKHSARKLSGGLAQFISFVRSVITEPDILILDEPFSNLDANLKNKIENYLIDHKLKRKIILVTHDLFQAQRLADEIILMDSGSMVSKSINKKQYIGVGGGSPARGYFPPARVEGVEPEWELFNRRCRRRPKGSKSKNPRRSRTGLEN